MSGNGIKELERPTAAGSPTEVVGVARRRSFSETFKRRILAEVSRARPGEIGLILRREGLYSSQLGQWRNGRSGMAQTKKHTHGTNNLRAENERLVKENARLKLQLRKAAAMRELQKKAAEILGYDDEKPGSVS